MNKKTILKAAAAFILTFVLILAIGSCNQKVNAKSKNKVEKTDAAEEQEETKNKKKTEATEGSRPLAGLSLYLQKAAEKNINILKILLERWQQEQDDIKLLAEVIYHENWHTDKERKAAYYTGAVVMNRVKSKNWPNTVKEVVYQKRQYAVVPKLFTEKIPDECYQMAKDIYRNGTPDVPANVVYQATFIQGSGDWIDPINGEHFCYE